MTFASISAVTISLLLVGMFLTVMLNLNTLASQVENNVQINVYMKLTASKQDQQALKEKIDNMKAVESIQYQSKEKGLQELMDDMDQYADVYQSLENNNPLPDQFIVKTGDPKQTQAVADKIKSMPQVDQVRFGAKYINKLFKVVEIARWVGLVLISGLLFTSIFLISNTIKLTIVARRTEIEIMKLVGATNGFVRWPYFMEGLMLGIIGAIVPVLAIAFGYKGLYEKYTQNYHSLININLIPYDTMTLYLSLFLLLIGAGIGVWGSTHSVRKFLKI